MEFDEADLLQAASTHVRGRVREDEPCNQHKMTMEVFELSRKIWLSDQDEIAIPVQDFDDTTLTEGMDLHDAIAAARLSRRKGAERPAVTTSASSPAIEHRNLVSSDVLNSWLSSEQVRSKTNDKQHDFLKLVVDRLLVEHDMIPTQQSLRKTSRRSACVVASWSTWHRQVTRAALPSRPL